MNIEVELPDLGDSGDQATISEWHFEEGEFVNKDEHLLEVLTGENSIEIPCPVSGILVERTVEEGELVRVGDVLGIVEVREETEFLSDADEE